MDHSTSKSDYGVPPDPELPRPFSSLINVDLFAISDPGVVRKTNEDHYLVVRAGRVLETAFSNLTESRLSDWFEETAYGMVVADGVGGEAAGEVASREAIFNLLNLVLRTPDWQFRWGPKERNTVMWRMQDRFRSINAALLKQAAAHAALSGMCTTMTVALTHGISLVIGHVGDSRAYLLRRNQLLRLTRDHTLAERFAAEGINIENDRLLAELKNVLVQVLGGNDAECTPEIHDHVIEDGDQLLLCTDGLTSMVDDSTIKAVLSQESSAEAACRNLIQLALSNGGRDNITTIVARYSIPQAGI